MNSIVALPIVAALPVASPLLTPPPGSLSLTWASITKTAAIDRHYRLVGPQFIQTLVSLRWKRKSSDTKRPSLPWSQRLPDYPISGLRNHRLHDEFEATRTAPTFDERKAIVEAMPEYNECMRLFEMQVRQRKLADDLVKQMWEIKAQTPEGRWAKVLVLPGYVMEDDEWRYTNAGVEPYDITRARDLLIEFVGGEASEQLRDQFAA